MGKIVVVGSINMDLVVRAPRIPAPGETIIGSELLENPGGKGANQCAAMAKLGGRVTMIGAVGSDTYGDYMKNNLTSLGVDTSGILVKEGVHSGIALITVDDQGQNNIVVIPGANGKLNKLDIDYLDSLFEDVTILVLQMEISMETLVHIIEKAYSLGIKILLNPAPAMRLDPNLYSLIDFLIPNESELGILSGIPCETLSEIEQAGKVMLGLGVKNLIVTMGSEGAVYMNNKVDQIHHYEARKVTPVDTTAAGDSFVGGFAIKIAEGHNVHEAIEFATKVAAITVCRKGAIASIPHLEEIEKENAMGK